jgi:hypothetical protein
MARIAQVRGMLLEEALLHLLRSTGYKTVDDVNGDPTLDRSSAGLLVRGRGTSHQIDAIADFAVYAPFSHPQRLLVEAKCFEPKKRVDLSIVRGALGTLKDVQEFWVSLATGPPKQRYHYQYAVFSATGYTENAQSYAFAQDIYLIPLAESRFFTPVVTALRNVSASDPNLAANADLPIPLGELRKVVRSAVRQGQGELVFAQFEETISGIQEFVAACRRISFSLLAVLGGRFPVFLVPAPGLSLDEINLDNSVGIYRGPNDQTWYLRDRNTNRELFSFDLPQELFLEYADQGMLSAHAALELKQQEMAEFEAVLMRNERPSLVRFRLDFGWLDRVRGRLRAQRLE